MPKAKLKLPAGITKRGGGYRWQKMIGGVRYGGTSATVEEAIRDHEVATARVRRGLPTATPFKAGDCWSLRKAVDAVCGLPAPEGWRGAKSEAQLAKVADSVVNHFGPSTVLSDITKRELDGFVTVLMDRGNSNATINRKMAALKKVMKVAWRSGGLATLPHFPKQLRENNARDRELTATEERTLLHTLRQLGREESAEAVECLIGLGCRPSELYAVEKRDCDLKRRLVFLYGPNRGGTKNGDYRSVPMSDRVRAGMGRRCGGLKATDRVFPFDNQWLRGPWMRARVMMGLVDDEQFIPYICRHTCASRLVRGGAPIPVVQRWLGHKTIQMTMRYAHLMPSDLLQHVGTAQAAE